MAEQSIGFATGSGAPFGDGNVGTGYDTARMTAMETKTLSDGVLQVGNDLAMSGIGTATLTIQDGAAIVGGYFYENTSSSAINISTLNGTYNVVIFVNSTSGPLTVSRSVAGTTVGTNSVRLAVATSAQLTGRVYLQLGTVTVTGAVIAAAGITPSYAMYGTTTQLPYQSYATMSGGSATLTLANTAYDVAGYSSPTSTSDGIFTNNTTTGFITVNRTGLYMISFYGLFSTGTTGQRSVNLYVATTLVQRSIITPTASGSGATVTWLYVVTAGQSVNVAVSSTLAGQSLASGTITISRA